MRFPPFFLDQIRDRVRVSEVVGRRVAWDKRKSQPARGDYWACCPFHDERSPSFHADDRRGHYHCFGCGASGDHFTFLIEKEGMSFPEAVELLAAEAGVPMPERDARDEERQAERASLHDVLEKAARFFQAELRGAGGARARAYLRDRGLKPETQARFRLGYAPSSRNALKEHLAAEGFTQEDMIAAGLLIAGDDIPVSYDRFRDRVIFPITDGRGRVIAFGGRALSTDQKAKYVNSPETALFRKGEVLFNGREARTAARVQQGHVVVVEGYVDVIACVAAGFETTVAPLGTALTESQLRLLWQMADEPILCFDGDEAGLKAAYRLIDVALQLLEPGKSLKFALLPRGQDPDDLLRVEGPEAFRKVLAEARPLIEMLWLRETQGATDLDTPERQAGLEARLYSLIAEIRNVEVLRRYRAHMRLRLAQLFDPYAAGWKGLKGARPKLADLRSAAPSAQGALERLILGFCVEYPSLLSDFVEEVCAIEFSSPPYRKFAEALHQLYVEYADVDVSLIYEKLSPEFYLLLQSIHGTERQIVVGSRQGTAGRAFTEKRGHKLRLLFPMLRYNPDEDLVQATMSFLLLKLQLARFEAHKPITDFVSAGGDADAFSRRVDGYIRQLNELRRHVTEQEAELEFAYQRLKASFADAAAA